MSWFETVAGAVAGGISGIYDVFTSERNYNYQKSVDKKNLQYNYDVLNYQKDYDANKYSIAAQDMSNAGINPLIMSGSTGSSSVSSSGGINSGVQSGNASGLTQLANTLLQSSSQQKMNKATNETSESVAETNADTQKEIADRRIKSEENIANNQMILNFITKLKELEVYEKDVNSGSKLKDSQTNRNEYDLNYLKNVGGSDYDPESVRTGKVINNLLTGNSASESVDKLKSASSDSKTSKDDFNNWFYSNDASKIRENLKKNQRYKNAKWYDKGFVLKQLAEEYYNKAYRGRK